MIGRTFDAIRLTFFAQVLRIGKSSLPTTYAAKVDAAQVGMYRVRRSTQEVLDAKTSR